MIFFFTLMSLVLAALIYRTFTLTLELKQILRAKRILQGFVTLPYEVRSKAVDSFPRIYDYSITTWKFWKWHRPALEYGAALDDLENFITTSVNDFHGKD